MKPRKPKSALSIQPGVEQPSSVNKNLTTSLPPHLPTSVLIDGILHGNRTILSRAITLVESNRPDHQAQAQEIIAECLKNSRDEGRRTKDEVILPTANCQLPTANSIRIGITGVPGVGKSTFIEALGKHLTARGHKLAVLAVDPSSTISKGSILGDKTRMESLAVDPNAFIRPSPTSGSLGGVARKTRETIYLCEAAGFDVIFVETVGVGQSETVVKSMVDFFLLLMLAGAGDELQGIKRGIIEMADAVVINKADGDNITRAKIAAKEYAGALHLFPPAASGWMPVVDTCSAVSGNGIPRVWETIEQFCTVMLQNGHFRQNRTDQNQLVFQQAIEEKLKEQFYNNKAIRKQILELEKMVREGTLNPYQAASMLFNP
ncbi:MAG: methylmalonyl Co-A mutase-associated GTPase MeaB [Bacteroidales bacterium]|nr:methylmalonyl Co-A mutase-associated GTPase MeaB [Bacteroidales bacterium]